MIDLNNLSLFLVATVALLVTPGPAVLYIVATSIDRGRRAGLMSTLGIAVGTLVHLLAAALGMSAILMTSAAAYTVVKFAGAAYLLFLGIQRLRQAGEATSGVAPERGSLWHVFWRGAAVNMLNPKTALFFFAFLPQFVDPSRGQVSIQVATLGVIFLVIAVMSDGMYAVLAGTAGGWLRRHRGFQHARRYGTGGVYVALAFATALSASRK